MIFLTLANINIAATHKVLVLNSYHKGYLWSDDITQGIEDALSYQVSGIHVEYMDTKRQYDTTYLNLLSDLLKYKHQKHHFNLIVTTDDNAFNFIKKCHNDLFKDIPVVFCGVNYLEKSDLENHGLMVGVNEKAELRENLKLIKRIHKQTNEILIITDNTNTGKKIQKEIGSLSYLSDSLGINTTLVNDITFDELKTKLNGLSLHTVVLYTFFSRDKNNIFLEYDQSTKFVCENSAVPVYGAWTFSLGHGIVGGYLTDGYDQGYIAGKKALAILDGEPIEKVGIDYNPPTKLMFDYTALNKHNITINGLKEEAKIINEPETFFSKYKTYIHIIGILLFVLVSSLIVQSFALRRMHLIKKKLAGSENRLRNIIDILPSLLFVKNAKGKFLAVNKTMAATMGMEPHEMEGKYQKNIHPNKAEVNQMLEEDKKVISTGKGLQSFEKSYHDIHGKRHWIQTIKKPVPKQVFGEDAIIGISVDITSLKETKKDLKYAHALNQNILETANVMVLTFDEERKIQSINRFAEEVTGYKKNEIIKTDWINLFAPIDRKGDMEKVFNKMLNKDQTYTYYENYILTKQGDKRLIAWNNSLLDDSENKNNIILSIGVDITERRMATMAIKQSENKFKSIFDYSPFGIIYYDAETKIIDCNNAFSNLIGSTKEALLGLDMSKLPDKELYQAIQNSLDTGIGNYDNYYHAVTSNKVTPVKGTFRGIKNSEGQFIWGIGMAEDISHQKQSEQKILDTNKELLKTTETLRRVNEELKIAITEAEKKKELEKANELLFMQKIELTSTIKKLKEAQSKLIEAEKMASVGILTSGIAHEINNPLNFIQGGKTALEMHLEDFYQDNFKEFKPFLSMIDDGIQRAVIIIQSLNRFNRRTKTYDEICHIDEIIENCLVMVQNQLKHRIEINKNYNHGNQSFLGNEGKIHQVMLNILNNAEQAIVGKGEITIVTEIENDFLKASFTDNGMGISKHDLKRISDPFFTTKDPGKGTGLGLSIAYNILKEHNGSISYESELGKGTTVHVQFPINVKN